MADNTVRLQKYMADNGIASRRKSEELIAAGKVRVNGRVASIGDKVNPKIDKVTVSGRKVAMTKEKVYIMLHKPRGYVTTMSDEMDRKCVAELVQNVNARVFPVGRLDRDSEGLLLMTNDGELANAISHPRTHVSKTYRVTVKGRVSEEAQASLSAGLMLDGRMTAPADVHTHSLAEDRSTLEITLYEGRNRQIRRMCEQLGIEVLRLKRIAIGKIKLGGLKCGDWRNLNENELSSIKTLVRSSAGGEQQ